MLFHLATNIKLGILLEPFANYVSVSSVGHLDVPHILPVINLDSIVISHILLKSTDCIPYFLCIYF